MHERTEKGAAAAGAGERAWLARSARIGGAVWLVRLILLHPGPFATAWAAAILLLAPLFLVPMALRLVAPAPGGRLWRAAIALQLPAALLLVAAFALPAGATAGALALPWLVVTVLLAFCGLLRLGHRGLIPDWAACVDAGLVFVVIGGTWTLLSRLGIRPLGFKAVIVLLAGIHLHYAGLILPLLTGLAARELGGRTSRAAMAAVVTGVPLVAAGITATQLHAPPLLECGAAWVMAAGGLLSAVLHARLAAKPALPRTVRVLWGVCAAFLGGGMLLASLYGFHAFGGIPWLDIPWMRALHGTAESLGFAVPGVLAWSLLNRDG